MAKKEYARDIDTVNDMPLYYGKYTESEYDGEIQHVMDRYGINYSDAMDRFDETVKNDRWRAEARENEGQAKLYEKKNAREEELNNPVTAENLIWDSLEEF